MPKASFYRQGSRRLNLTFRIALTTPGLFGVRTRQFRKSCSCVWWLWIWRLVSTVEPVTCNALQLRIGPLAVVKLPANSHGNRARFLATLSQRFLLGATFVLTRTSFCEIWTRWTQGSQPGKDG